MGGTKKRKPAPSKQGNSKLPPLTQAEFFAAVKAIAHPPQNTFSMGAQVDALFAAARLGGGRR
jgi:hypothetical protein